jgi:putative transposase
MPCPYDRTIRKTRGRFHPTIIRSYKSSATRHINLLRGTPGTPVWLRNYYEHVVRNDDDLQAIREYILANPTRWDEDNPALINHGVMNHTPTSP